MDAAARTIREDTLLVLFIKVVLREVRMQDFRAKSWNTIVLAANSMPRPSNQIYILRSAVCGFCSILHRLLKPRLVGLLEGLGSRRSGATPRRSAHGGGLSNYNSLNPDYLTSLWLGMAQPILLQLRDTNVSGGVAFANAAGQLPAQANHLQSFTY